MFRILLPSALVLSASAAMAAGMAMHPAGDGSPADHAYAAAMDRMMAGMRTEPTGNPDYDFVTMMIPHHAGAIDMAQVELKYGRDPELLALARTIVADQTKEVGLMQDWLKSHPK